MADAGEAAASDAASSGAAGQTTSTTALDRAVDVTSPSGLTYWCHTCKTEVDAVLEGADGEISCRACGRDFVELVESDDDEEDPSLFVPPTPSERRSSGAVPPAATAPGAAGSATGAAGGAPEAAGVAVTGSGSGSGATDVVLGPAVSAGAAAAGAAAPAAGRPLRDMPQFIRDIVTQLTGISGDSTIARVHDSAGALSGYSSVLAGTTTTPASDTARGTSAAARSTAASSVPTTGGDSAGGATAAATAPSGAGGVGGGAAADAAARTSNLFEMLSAAGLLGSEALAPLGALLGLPTGDVDPANTQLASDLGNYAFGSLERIINQLMAQDSGARGPPPTSKSVLERLPVIKISHSDIEDEAECAVCCEALEVGDEGLKVPCGHVFHNACIRPWLEEHNSCPVCRKALPTEDEEYNQRHHLSVSPRPSDAADSGAAAPGAASAVAAVAPPGPAASSAPEAIGGVASDASAAGAGGAAHSDEPGEAVPATSGATTVLTTPAAPATPPPPPPPSPPSGAGSTSAHEDALASPAHDGAASPAR